MRSMGKAKAWLVSDCGGAWSDAYEFPVRAFTDEGMARKCARKREERGTPGLFDDYGWCSIHEIELVIS